jgi:hypothetical protein
MKKAFVSLEFKKLVPQKESESRTITRFSHQVFSSQEGPSISDVKSGSTNFFRSAPFPVGEGFAFMTARSQCEELKLVCSYYILRGLSVLLR